jgi:hypothetical protein
MSAPHLLHATSPLGYGVRIECPGPDEGHCRVLYEADSCQCIDPQCPSCVMTDSGYDPEHNGCDSFPWGDNDALGAAACMLRPLDGCGAVDWYSNVGQDMIADAEWPGESPWKAAVSWESGGEYMVLVPWSE